MLKLIAHLHCVLQEASLVEDNIQKRGIRKDNAYVITDFSKIAFSINLKKIKT